MAARAAVVKGSRMGREGRLYENLNDAKFSPTINKEMGLEC